ncbi:uncharacterized protein LOC144859940 [Branchiostoma floridae x Branchiostoma japonicum]
MRKTERGKENVDTGTPSEISTFQDLVNSIVSIVESSDDIEGTSADTASCPTYDVVDTTTEKVCAYGVATGKELFSIGEDTKGLEMARDKLLAEMSALKESNKCPGKHGYTVGNETRGRIREAVHAFVKRPSPTCPPVSANSGDLDPSATIPIDTANGGDLNPSATIHIVTADKVEILDPSAIRHPVADNSGDLDPEKVTCHDSVRTTGRNSFWNQPPLTSPFVFDIKTEGRIYIRLSAENNGLPDMYRINSYPWGPKIYRRTKGKWIAKVHVRTQEIWDVNDFLRLWVRWSDDGFIGLYRGGRPDPVINWTDPNPLPIRHVGYSTVFKPGVFRFNCY